jgi:hypothetical protein
MQCVSYGVCKTFVGVLGSLHCVFALWGKNILELKTKSEHPKMPTKVCPPSLEEFDVTVD